MIVSRLTSNVKTARAIDLAPCTLLVGDNAAGKSGIVAALELVLTGRCQEAGATPSALMELAAGEGGLKIEAIIHSEGGNSLPLRFGVDGTTSKASKAVWAFEGTPVQQPIGSILTSEVLDLLSKEPKRQREALLSICCPEVTAESIRARLPEAFWQEWEAVWRQTTGGDADRLVATAEGIRSALRAARVAMKAAGPDIRPVAPSDAEVTALRDQAKRAQDATALRNAKERAARELPSMRDRLETLRLAIQNTGGQDPVAIRQAAKVITAAKRLVELLAQAKSGRCTACGQHVQDRTWAERLTVISSKLADLIAQEARPEVAEIDVLHAQIEAAEVVLGTPFPEGTPEILEDPIPLTQALAARGRLHAWEENRAEAQRAAQRADVLKALSGVADRIVADILEGSVSAFCARAQEAFGSEAERISIQLFDGSRSVCRVGLGGNGRPFRSWKVLSGAERMGLVAALAAAWGASRQEPVKLCIVDDCWLGRNALTVLCSALHTAVSSGAISQAIVCAVEDYGLEPGGWKAVKL